jgi:hypothetical protein
MQEGSSPVTVIGRAGGPVITSCWEITPVREPLPGRFPNVMSKVGRKGAGQLRPRLNAPVGPSFCSHRARRRGKEEANRPVADAYRPKDQQCPEPARILHSHGNLEWSTVQQVFFCRAAYRRVERPYPGKTMFSRLMVIIIMHSIIMPWTDSVRCDPGIKNSS